MRGLLAIRQLFFASCGYQRLRPTMLIPLVPFDAEG